MVAVPLGLTTYRRRGARTAEIALINVILENDPTNQVDGKVRIQRPALSSFADVGFGPIRGVFRRAGVLSSDWLVVSGAGLYRVNATGFVTFVGLVPGTDLVQIDGQSDRAIVVAAGIAWSTDGATVVQVNMPDGRLVGSVAWIGGYFILTELFKQRFYWLAPGDVDPSALNFASAENSPDAIIGAARLLDELWFFGEQSTEVFRLTGNLDAPFQPIGGRLYEKGCANRNTIATLDNSLFWVGNDLIAYRADTTPLRISDHSMEERLRMAGLSDLRCWAYELDGHTFYCMRAGTQGTYTFDVESQTWPRFKSYNSEVWRAHLGAQIAGDKIIAGDDTLGKLWYLDQDRSNDNGDPLEREVTGGVTVLGQIVKCSSFSVRVAVGWGPLTGTSADPIIEMCYSDDGGNTFSSWEQGQLGLQGEYQTEVVWRQLGIINEPGRIFRVRMTDDAIFRISYARMNEAVSI